MKNFVYRTLEPEIKKWLDSKEIIAIRGPRQCGKTTLLKRIKEILNEKGVKDEYIHYVSFEDDLEKEKFEKNPKDYIKYYMAEKGRHYFLFDEVEYLKNAGKTLKLAYDSFEEAKIIVTGSSTLDLNEVGSYLVGRILLFELYPFSFPEYLSAKDERLYEYYKTKKKSLEDKTAKEEELIFINELNIRLKDYLVYGGYPAVVLEKDAEKKKFLLRNLYLTYIEKDIVKVYGPKYKQRIMDLVRYLSSLNAAMINYEEIGSATGLYYKEVRDILSILEETYVIKQIKPFHRNLVTELKKNPKTYFVDTGLRNFIAGRFEFSEEEYGRLLENHALSLLRRGKANYWRTAAKAEVDFVYNEKTPVESKTTPKITRSLRSFIETYKPKTAFILNLKQIREEKTGDTTILIIPHALME